MKTLEWSEALWLDYPPMDSAHRQWVALLSLARAASNEALPSAWAAVSGHCEMQFGEEDGWMRKTRFPASSNHLLQHRLVLNLVREGSAMARNGQFAPVREMADELAGWLVRHTQTMDAELAQYLKGKNPLHPARQQRVNHVKRP